MEVRDIGMATFKLAHILDVLQLHGDKWMIHIAVAVHQAQHRTALLPAVLARQPSRRFGQQHHHQEEEDGRDHLQAPRDTEGGRGPVIPITSANVGAAIGNVVHDQNAPCDGPLLHANEAASFGWWRNLGNVDGNLSALNADTETVDDSTDDEHANVL